MPRPSACLGPAATAALERLHHAADLDALARRVLGVSLAEVRKALPR